MSGHTAGAMRAAAVIMNSREMFETEYGRKTAEGIMDLIDRETAAPELLAACKRALPWIGKMIADGAHLNSVAPNDCVGAMQQLDAAIKKAEGK